jgi:heme/copper-type cytochrome/quinol oxidase subunit 4
MALVKGALIMMYYMHLKSDSAWFTLPMAFGLILATGMLISMIGLYIGSARTPCTPQLGGGCVVEAAK